MRTTFFKGVVLGSVVSVATVFSTAALVGTGVGGVFNLGKSNSVNAETGLTGSTNGAQLQVTNNGTGANATGLDIHVPSGKAPLSLNSAAKVANLNADQLDGLDSSQFQRKTKYEILPIDTVPSFGQIVAIPLAPSDLEVVVWCRHATQAGAFSNIVYQNQGTGAADLNWEYADRLGALNDSGAGVAAGSAQYFDYNSGANGSTPGRLEGQWIWGDSHYTVTVNLHAFEGSNFCEVRGTAEIVANS